MSERLRDTHEDWSISALEYARQRKAVLRQIARDRLQRNLAMHRARAEEHKPAAPAPVRPKVAPPRSPIAQDLGIRSVVGGIHGIRVPFVTFIHGDPE